MNMKKHVILEKMQTVKRMDPLLINTTEPYLAIKRKGLLVHARTRVNLRNIMLRGSSLTHKNTYSMIPFI